MTIAGYDYHHYLYRHMNALVGVGTGITNTDSNTHTPIYLWPFRKNKWLSLNAATEGASGSAGMHGHALANPNKQSKVLIRPAIVDT